MSSGRTRWDSTRWDIVALALAAGYVVGFQVGKVPPALPLLEAELGLPRVIAGLIASSFYGVGAVFGVVSGVTIDRLGARRMVLAGAAVMALASLAGGLAGSGTLLLATRIVEGFGFATLTVAAPKLIAAATRAEVRRLALGAWGTYMPVGMALSLVIATAVLDSIGWRGLWFLNAGLILLYALAFARWTAPRRWHPLADAGTAGDGADRHDRNGGTGRSERRDAAEELATVHLRSGSHRMTRPSNGSPARRANQPAMPLKSLKPSARANASRSSASR